jgi:ribosomal protein L29
MKRKDFIETKTKPLAELEKAVTEAQVRLRGLQFDLAAGKVQNIKEIRVLRKTIAQLFTLITVAKKGTQPHA